MTRTYHVSFPGLGLDMELSPVAFSVGSFSVYWYGIIIATGFMLAVLYCMKTAKRRRTDPDKFLNSVIVGLITAIIGARAYYVAFSWSSFRGDLRSIINIHEGGLAIYGGIIGGLIGGLITAKIQKAELLPMLDVAATGFLIGQGIGRWGNFVNQEAFGTQTDLPWRMVSENTGGVGVHPCFLYESLWCLLGFTLIHFLLLKRQRFEGEIFFAYLVWYGFERTLVEGLRTDSLYLPFADIRVSQLLSGVLFVTGLALLIVNLVKHRADVPFAAETDSGSGEKTGE